MCIEEGGGGKHRRCGTSVRFALFSSLFPFSFGANWRRGRKEKRVEQGEGGREHRAAHAGSEGEKEREEERPSNPPSPLLHPFFSEIHRIRSGERGAAAFKPCVCST